MHFLNTLILSRITFNNFSTLSNLQFSLTPLLYYMKIIDHTNIVSFAIQ